MFGLGPGLARVLVEKPLCTLKEALELRMEIAVHHCGTQFILHSRLDGLKLRLSLELLRHVDF